MNGRPAVLMLLNQAPALLLVVVALTLGTMSSKFLELQNVVNILVQSSSTAIAAIGMTLVLLTAGVDLSVGSVMFLAVAVAGKMISAGYSVAASFTAAALVGVTAGLLNALMITRLRIIPFIATLGMLFVIRGFGLWLTNTRAINMPERVTALGAAKFGGLAVPVIILFAVVVSANWFLRSTPWGRQVYAIGQDAAAARRAGIAVDKLLVLVYVLCGLCAGLSGIVALTQTGAVSPSFGQQKEFAAIAAAVLGGTSVFGGRGTVLPGTLLGALLFQTVENGLVIINADPYLYPLILSGVIFIAVLLDTLRTRMIAKLTRRQIRAVEAA